MPRREVSAFRVPFGPAMVASSQRRLAARNLRTPEYVLDVGLARNVALARIKVWCAAKYPASRGGGRYP